MCAETVPVHSIDGCAELVLKQCRNSESNDLIIKTKIEHSLAENEILDEKMEEVSKIDGDLQVMCDHLEQQGHDWLILSIGRYPDTNHMCSGSTLGLSFLRQRTDIIDDFLVYITNQYDATGSGDEDAEGLPISEDTNDIYVTTVASVDNIAQHISNRDVSVHGSHIDLGFDLQTGHLSSNDRSYPKGSVESQSHIYYAAVPAMNGITDNDTNTIEVDANIIDVTKDKTGTVEIDPSMDDLTDNEASTIKVETIIDVSDVLKETKCNVCSRQFSSHRALSAHMRIHKTKLITGVIKKELSEEKSNYTCELCGKRFEFESYLRMHQDRKNSCVDENRKYVSESNELITFKDHDGVEKSISISDAVEESVKYTPHACVVCGHSLAGSVSQVRRHIIAKHTSGTPHTCEYCQKSFKLKDVLMKHKSRIHSNKDFIAIHCKLCNKQFETEKQMKLHMVLKCKKRDHNCVCALCGYKALGPASLEKHLRTHSGMKPFSCEQCDKSFSSKTNLNAHISAMHSSELEFVCDTCDITFSTRSQYRHHMQKHSPPKFFCDICDKHFFEASSFRSHALIHTSSIPFTCEFCGKTFRWAKNLTIHRRTHTGDKPYKCEICEKSYSTLDSLKVHTSTHKGTKHVCDVCGRTYSHLSRLKEHVRSHDNQPRRFTCRFCEDTFSSFNILKTHLIKQHADKQKEIENESRIKLHKCTIGTCSKLFGTPQKLKRHVMVAHTKSKPFKCLYCSAGFNDENNKRRHEKKHLTDDTFGKNNKKKKQAMLVSVENIDCVNSAKEGIEKELIDTDKTLSDGDDRNSQVLTMSRETAGSTEDDLVANARHKPERIHLYSSVLQNSTSQNFVSDSNIPSNNSPLPSISSQFLTKQSSRTNNYLSLIQNSDEASNTYCMVPDQSLPSQPQAGQVIHATPSLHGNAQFHQFHQGYVPSVNVFENLPTDNSQSSVVYAVSEPSEISTSNVVQDSSGAVAACEGTSNFHSHNFIQNL